MADPIEMEDGSWSGMLHDDRRLGHSAGLTWDFVFGFATGPAPARKWRRRSS